MNQHYIKVLAAAAMCLDLLISVRVLKLLQSVPDGFEMDYIIYNTVCTKWVWIDCPPTHKVRVV